MIIKEGLKIRSSDFVHVIEAFKKALRGDANTACWAEAKITPRCRPPSRGHGMAKI